MGLIARDKVRAAEAQANLYGLKCQHAALLATWRYLTGRPVVF
ncbi:MAG: hypothetical protein AB1330_11795 [Bacillota bacterium]